MSTQIVGLFTNTTFNVEKVLCEVLDTGQADHQMHYIGHGGTPPECNIGYDKNGVSIVTLREHGYGHKDNWLVWRRSDYEVRDIHDPHTLGPVFAFESPGPGRADTPFTLTENVIDFCKAAYRIQTQTAMRGRSEIKSAIEKSGSDMLPVPK